MYGIEPTGANSHEGSPAQLRRPANAAHGDTIGFGVEQNPGGDARILLFLKEEVAMNTEEPVPAGLPDTDIAKAAVRAVHGLAGVRGVSDMMTIHPTVSATVVKSEIERALRRAARNDANEISVDVRGSDVTLSGAVYSLSERELIRSTAWATPGVRNVVDNMTVAF